MPEVMVKLAIPPEEYLKFYQGVSKTVYAKATDGRSVAFPADALRPFVEHHGINGTFKICFDNAGKLTTVEKLL